MVRNQLQVFVNCAVNKPAFDSQSKQRLTTHADEFGFAIRVSDKLATSIADGGVERAVVEAAMVKDKAVSTMHTSTC